ncbi:MAG: hypothetical protein M3Z21_11405 [Pseudomonadota bacterium]|nr:hypothetical protein [Pseudomonadota bacterium]
MASRRRESCAILFVAAAVALNYPLLAVFDRLLLPLGIPLLYLYLFVVWAAVIVAMAWIMRQPPAGDGAE